MSRRSAALLVMWLGAIVCAAAAQRGDIVATRRLTTIDAIRQFPSYFNLQNVVLRGEFIERSGRVVFAADERQLDVLLGDEKTQSGAVEVRGQVLDVGRLEPGDPRLSRYTGSRDAEHWPKPGEEVVLNVTGVTATDPSPAPTVRALALEPWRFEGQKVTVSGQFRGRNLFGDLPGAPARSRYDFVLKSGDGAIWATGIRPRGRGFDLDVDSRVDTSRWVEVTGVVRREKGLVLIEASGIVAAQPVIETATSEPATEAAPPPTPVQVVFSSPTEGENDVATSTTVRVQFSRGLDPASVKGSVRATYAPMSGGSADEPIDIETSYDIGRRAVEIKFAKPLAPLRTVKVETLPALKGFDGAPVESWTLTFTLGS